jgi:hypothetical protein
MAARDVVVTAAWTVTVVALHRAGVALFTLVPIGAAVCVLLGVPSWRAARARPRLAPDGAPSDAEPDAPRDTEVLATLMELQLLVRGEAVRVADLDRVDDVDDDAG